MIKWINIIQFKGKENPIPPFRIEKTDDQWKSLLTEEEFYVTRKKGTERAFTGEFCSSFEAGLYGCRCCGTPLFNSNEKFESGTGWPSFTQPLEENLIKYIKDNSFGMIRVEVQCNICDAHLGHVFPDGPPPSELRYCINSVSLQKLKE